MHSTKPRRAAATGALALAATVAFAAPGDYKGGYHRTDYSTDSKALDARTGTPADLLALAQDPPLGLPPLPVPETNPLTREKIQLGRKLFYDRRLSLNDTMSCAMCHVPEQGFANNELALAVGIEGRTVRRNAPTLFNVGYLDLLFHDGRESRLEQQAWQPMLAHNEMGAPSIGFIVEKIRHMPDYDGLFEQAFGHGPTLGSVGDAIASYERALLAADSPFDRWRFGGNEAAVSDAAKRGFELFTGKAGCSQCHTVADDHALFTDGDLHNTGIGWKRAMGKEPESYRVLAAPGVWVNVPRDMVRQVSNPVEPDLGRYEVTQDPADRWKYRTPSLRNIALTAPYMHDGSLLTLQEVVDFYAGGGHPNENLDPKIRPLQLDERDKADLVAFLRSLTGSNVPALVSDAFAAPVGDLGELDPHWAHDRSGDTR